MSRLAGHRAAVLAAVAVAAAATVGVGCTTDPSYLEAHGHFGAGEVISFKEPATLTVGVDATSGAQFALVRGLNPNPVDFKGVDVQVDLSQVAAGGSYPAHADGQGAVQIRLVLPMADGGVLDLTEYTADGTLTILELPTAGNNRFIGSFANVTVNHDGADLTIDYGSFLGQL